MRSCLCDLVRCVLLVLWRCDATRSEVAHAAQDQAAKAGAADHQRTRTAATARAVHRFYFSMPAKCFLFLPAVRIEN